VIFKRAFDCVGDIAILEIPDALVPKEKKIAATLLHINPAIKTVVKKSGGHTGIFRLQKYKILAGERRKTTIHKESGAVLKIHLEHTYYSPRMGTERLRIARLVHPGEDILVMFSGIAPYNIVLAKNTAARTVYGVEINPKAHALAEENIVRNKVEDRCKLFCGDVRKIVPPLPLKFDRIIMPLPKGGEDFLDIALAKTKRGTTIHFYDFLPEADFVQAREKIRAACRRNKKNCTVLGVHRCGQQGPRVFRICTDFCVGTKRS